MLLGQAFRGVRSEKPGKRDGSAVLETGLSFRKTQCLVLNARRLLQYTRDLMFATVVRLMTEVVLACRGRFGPPIKTPRKPFPCRSPRSTTNSTASSRKVSAELVRDSAAPTRPIVRRMRGTAPKLLPGYRVRILDGNHLSGTEHRLAALRTLRAGALPGQTLVVLDPSLGLVVDVVPCEDGHAPKSGRCSTMFDDGRSRAICGIADRNFLHDEILFWNRRTNGGFFVIRQHA